DIGKIDFVTTGDHHVVQPAEHYQPPGVPATPISSVKSAVDQDLGREVWAQPVASEERGAFDQDLAIVRDVDDDASQWHAVIDTAAARLAHAVGGHHPDAR